MTSRSILPFAFDGWRRKYKGIQNIGKDQKKGGGREKKRKG
jgi:hypothetical protein